MPCVYTVPEGLCDGTAPLSKNEHYLPRALGTFKGDERLVDRICDSCQRRFSQFEDVFAHNSAEAFFREMVGRLGRKKHRRKNIFYEPTLGISPLTVLGKYPDHDFEILWELTGPDGCAPMSQLVFIGKDGKTFALPFRSGKVNASKIRTVLKERGVAADQIVAISSSADEAAEMKLLTDELAPKGEERDGVAPLVNGVELEGEMRAAISPEYLRAIAKIGFHFVLQYFTQFSGLEPEFDDMKRFIYEGVAGHRIVEPLREPFVRELQQGARMRRWGHLLSAEASEQGFEARMQFFAGPKVEPIVWRVLIGRNPSRIIYKQSVGRAFLYFDDLSVEFHGELIELTALERIVVPTSPFARLVVGVRRSFRRH